MQEEQNDIYIKLLNGTLTESEILQLQSTGEYAVLEKLLSDTANWKVAPVKDSFQEFKAKKLSGKKKKSTSWFKIAASVAIIIGISSLTYFRFFNITTFQTAAGESLAITLPDGCNVQLNGNSTLSYNNWGWSDNRKVNLNGQAYFDVGVKGPFQVSFKGGTVDVLGTEFDVMSHNNLSVVKCFEGTVEVSFTSKTYRLTRNMGVRQTESNTEEEFNFEGEKSSWMEKNTRFDNAPFNEVLNALELRFGIEFTDRKNIHPGNTFTGQFPNNSEAIALKIVSETLGVTFKKEGNLVIIH